ncbi:MAG: Crp/Fnr family transcriptional regulator [Deltaproteobacteria bacterium]|nr:Crp/Fnr family transcriptional regulator [Deltaproteobacteria bacterium]
MAERDQGKGAPSAAHLQELLGRHPLFVGLDGAARLDIVDRASELHLDVGDVLYQSGSKAEAVFVILSGALQIEYPTGHETRGPVAAIIIAPGFLGECQVLGAVPFSGTGVALTPLLALGIKQRELLGMIERHPTLTRRLYLELSQRFLTAIETWRFQPEINPELSIARYLVGADRALAAVDASRSGHRLGLRQVDIGRATGLRRETVNRIIGKWTERGLVRSDGAGIELKDLPALAAIVAASPAVELTQQIKLPSEGDEAME